MFLKMTVDTSGNRVTIICLFYKFLLITTAKLISFDKTSRLNMSNIKKVTEKWCHSLHQAATQDEPHQQHLERDMRIAVFLHCQVWGLQCWSHKRLCTFLASSCKNSGLQSTNTLYKQNDLSCFSGVCSSSD